MSSPLVKSVLLGASRLESNDTLLTDKRSASQPVQSPISASDQLLAFPDESLPCVVYQCSDLLELTDVSENFSELLGLDSRTLLGKSLLSVEIIPAEDLVRLSNRVAELQHVNRKTSLIHRIVNKSGLPLWVLHSFWKSNLNDTIIVRGCITPMNGDARLDSVEQTVISRFVHKLGNHFQLLNLVVSSLTRTVSESRETLILQETLEKAIELTRNFSDYNQTPTCLSRVELKDLLEAATMTKKSLFETKGITLESQIDATVSGAVICCDSYLLDLALGHVLQNAIEATDVGGRVALCASVACSNNGPPVATISIVDSGCGISESSLADVLLPFFTSKKNHDGLGLSMASRFVEIHGGILQIRSKEGEGTSIEMRLPIETER
ncbi:MAG: ATP-binding protein [Candidatus Binatia bacterium]